MPPSSTKHDLITKAVEKELRRFGRDYLEDEFLDCCILMWHDFAQHVKLNRTRKPETWAAAAFYAYDQIVFRQGTQEEAANIFKVNKNSIGPKYREIASILSLRFFDERYLPEDASNSIMAHILSDSDAAFLEDTLNQPGQVGGFWEDDVLDPAQQSVYDGWEVLYVDPGLAQEFFEIALDMNPNLADAHNGLAEVFLIDGNLNAAEQHYDKAYELARKELGSESPEAYIWWGELETRPYMRARQGRAQVYWGKGEIKKAISEFKALLHINPNDNQGVRFVIAPLCLLANEPEALQAFEQYYTNYSGDFGDPYISFSHGLALYESGQHKQAVLVWHKAMLDNIYMAPLLSKEPVPEPEVDHGTNLQGIIYANEYLESFKTMWTRTPGAIQALRSLWLTETTQKRVNRYIELSYSLSRENKPVDMNDQQLINKRMAIAEERFELCGKAPALSDEDIRQILNSAK